MTRIDELQGRITQALERISVAVESWQPVPEAPAAQDIAIPADAAPEPQADPEEVSALRGALEDEKLVTAQLEERIRALHARLDNESAGLREQVGAQRDSLAQLDAELQRLRQANDALRRSNEALREANAKGVGEPHLINKAMLAELEGLRSARAAEAAETRMVIDVLEPLLAQAGASGAAQGPAPTGNAGHEGVME